MFILAFAFQMHHCNIMNSFTHTQWYTYVPLLNRAKGGRCVMTNASYRLDVSAFQGKITTWLIHLSLHIYDHIIYKHSINPFSHALHSILCDYLHLRFLANNFGVELWNHPIEWVWSCSCAQIKVKNSNRKVYCVRIRIVCWCFYVCVSVNINAIRHFLILSHHFYEFIMKRFINFLLAYASLSVFFAHCHYLLLSLSLSLALSYIQGTNMKWSAWPMRVTSINTYQTAQFLTAFKWMKSNKREKEKER